MLGIILMKLEHCTVHNENISLRTMNELIYLFTFLDLHSS
jgi:hypothetical protein